MKLADYQLLVKTRPTELYALKNGDYTMRQETNTGYTVILRGLPKDFKVLHRRSQNGSLGPYSQIILENDGRADKSTAGALLLGNRFFGTTRLVLLVALRRQATTSGKLALHFCGLLKLEEREVDRWLKDHASNRPEIRRQRDISDDNAEGLQRILGIADGFEQTVSTAGGTYNARAEIQDCFGKPVIFVDVSVRPRRLNGIRILSRNTALLFQNHARGCSGINKAMLLLLLGPRLFTEVVETLARELAEAAANSWYMSAHLTGILRRQRGMTTVWLREPTTYMMRWRDGAV